MNFAKTRLILGVIIGALAFVFCSYAGNFTYHQSHFELPLHPLKPFSTKQSTLLDLFYSGLLDIGNDFESYRNIFENDITQASRVILGLNQFLADANNPRPGTRLTRKKTKDEANRKALEWISSICKENNSIAWFLMGHVNRYGWYGHQINHEEAKAFYEKSAELGYLIAKHILAQWCLLMGDENFRENAPEKAQRYLEEAAQGGYTKSHALLLESILNKKIEMPLNQVVSHIFRAVENEWLWFEYIENLRKNKTHAENEYRTAQSRRPQRAGAPFGGGGNGGILAVVVAVTVVAAVEVANSNSADEQLYKRARENLRLASEELSAHKTEHEVFLLLKKLNSSSQDINDSIAKFKKKIDKKYREIPIENFLSNGSLNLEKITATAAKVAKEISMIAWNKAALIILREDTRMLLAPIINDSLYEPGHPEPNAFFEFYKLSDESIAISIGKEAIEASRQYVNLFENAAAFTMLKDNHLETLKLDSLELLAGVTRYKLSTILSKSPTLYNVHEFLKQKYNWCL